MKDLVLAFLFLCCAVFSYSQQSPNRNNFSVLIGTKYTPFDYIGGGVIGVSCSRDKFTLSLRNDVSMSINRIDSLAYFGITKFVASNYLDLKYSLSSKSNVSLGYGWISNKNTIVKLNKEYGYSVLSVGIDYKLSKNLFVELKGDIPLIDKKSRLYQDIHFPVSVCLFYKIS